MKIGRLKAITIGAGGCAIALLILGFMLFAAQATRLVRPEHATADGIVVLTGGDARITEAARLLQRGYARRLLISGVNRRTTRDDLRRLMDLSPVLFDCCVDIGYEALDTAGNADEARAWANRWQFNSLIVVTASYHMPRSLAEIALALPEAKLLPHSVMPRKLQLEGTPWWLRFAVSRTLVAEYVKFLPVATRLMAARLVGRRDGAVVAQGRIGNDNGVTAVNW